MIFKEEACDLFKQIPKEKLKKLFKESDASAEIDYTFLGFEESYQKVKKLTTEDMIILDLGCAYATQSWYFKDYAAYIGVDIGTFMDSQSLPYEENLKGVLQTDNSTFYFETIQSFIKETLPTLNLDLNKVFAVCSAVPDKEARKMMKNIFPNYLDWYPGEEMKIIMNGQRIYNKDDCYVSVSRGKEKSFLLPLMDYLNNRAINQGYDCYKDMVMDGYSIEISELYNKNYEKLDKIATDRVKKEIDNLYHNDYFTQFMNPPEEGEER